MKLGERLGDRFEIEQQIGTGAMGEVFRARDPVTGEAVAVKILPDGRGRRSVRFAREIELLAALSHPGIVRYISHGVTPGGEPFLVMEWLDGEDLERRLSRGPLALVEAVDLAAQVAAALGAAHARGIIHRDLKPGNLFLCDGRADRVKILDFGVASRDARDELTDTGELIGTPGYMAPEQAEGREAIDARADVFALGCVLFRCLTGAEAFSGSSVIDTLEQILFREAPRIAAQWPGVPEELDALVARMLAKDPAARPADGAALGAALAAIAPLARAVDEPSRRGPPPAAITGGERRLRAVVLVGAGGAGGALGPREEALRQAIEPYGGRLEPIATPGAAGSVAAAAVVLDAAHQVATDLAARAARCALALRELAGDRPLAIAMGRAEPTVQLLAGDALAGALEQLRGGAPARPRAGGGAARGPIALDEMTAGLLDAGFDVVEGDAGLRLCGERALAQGARTLLGRPTACVGRDWELGALAGILDECIAEPEARAVVVTAPAGIGKSRLAAELVARVHERELPVAIWTGRGDSLRAGATLDLLGQALRGALGIRGGEPLEERRALICARVAERLPPPEHRRVAELLGELVGAPFSDEGPGGAALRAARQDPQLMSEQLRRAWMDFLAAEVAARPILLVLEDLHWGDFGTVRFIDVALRDRAGLPWMVLALARPEVHATFPRLWAERGVREIRLKELGKKAGERLVRQVLGDRVGPQTIERLVRQADGNAFYLEELIRAAAEGRGDALPETVVAMVEARLARLPVEARRVLRAASVLGEVCWEGGVAALLAGAMSAAAVGGWIDRLVAQELFVARPASRFPGDRELAFRHALVREGAYASLPEDDRQLGHRLAGEWLERQGEADPMVLAGHCERGGDGARAASHYLAAAEQALHVLDLEAAMARAGLGLGCAAPAERRNALLGIRCEISGYGLQKLSVTMADGQELMRAAPRGSIPWIQGVIAYIQGLVAFSEGDALPGAAGELLAVIALLGETEPFPEAAGRMTFALLASICILDNLGRVADGSALEARLFAITSAAGEREPLARFWWDILLGLRASYAHGDPWSALQHAAAIRPLFDVVGGERIFLNMELFRGLNLWYLGAAEAAERTLEAIPAADESLGMASSLRRFGLAWLRADRGALEGARALAGQLAEYGRAHHLPMEEGRGRWALAEVLRRMGELGAAEREILPALELAVPLERPGALGTLAAIRLAQGRAADALVVAEEALAGAREMGGCGLFRGAFVRLVHAEALAAAGARGAARRAIGDAQAHLLEIAGRIADPELRAGFLDRVPENTRIAELARVWLAEGE